MAIKAITNKASLLDLLDSPTVAKNEAQVQASLGVTVPTKAETVTSPQTTGGSVSNAAKSPVTTPTAPTASYTSKRLADYAPQGTARTSKDEILGLPRVYIANAMKATQGMAKAPALGVADYLTNKDTYTSKREDEGSLTTARQVQERSEKYQQTKGAENKANAQKIGELADKIDLYNPENVLTRREDELISSSEKGAKIAEESKSNRKSVKDYIAESDAMQQKVREETGAKFTLLDMAATMGQMLPSQIAGGVVGNIAKGLASGTELGQAMTANWLTQGNWDDITKAAAAVEAGTGTATDVYNAVQAARDVMNGGLANIGQTVGALGTMYGQVYGNSYDEARARGADVATALDYANAHALVETGTEVLGGGIPGMGEGIASNALKNVAGKLAAKYGGETTAKVMAKVVAPMATFFASPTGKMVIDIVGEGAEEAISEVYGPWIEQNTLDPNAPNATFSDVALAALEGMLTSLFMQKSVQVLESAARKGAVYKYNPETKMVEKAGTADTTAKVDEATGQPVKAGEVSAESAVATVTPATVEEAVAQGTPSTAESMDNANRESAIYLYNAFLTENSPSARARLAESDLFGGEAKAKLKSFTPSSGELVGTLPMDASWEQIRDAYSKIGAAQVTRSADAGSMISAAKAYADMARAPYVTLTTDMISDKVAQDYIKANKLKGNAANVETAKRAIVNEFNAKTKGTKSRDAYASAVKSVPGLAQSIMSYATTGNDQDVARKIYGKNFWEARDNYLKLRTQENVNKNRFGHIRTTLQDGTTVMADASTYLQDMAARMGKTPDQLTAQQRSRILEDFDNTLGKSRKDISALISDLNTRGAKTGLKVEQFTPTPEEYGRTGDYDAKTKTIRISDTSDSVDAVRFYLSHELVHHALNIMAPEQKAAFRSYVEGMADSIGVDLKAEAKYLQENFEEYRDPAIAEEEAYARFFTDLLGSSDMLVEMAEANPAALNDFIGYAEATIAQDTTASKDTKRAEVAALADAKAAENGVLEEREAKRSAPLAMAVPESVMTAAQIGDTETAPVAEEAAPSETMGEAREKADKVKAVGEVFANKPIQMPKVARADGFQRIAPQEGEALTLEQVAAGEGAKRRSKMKKASDEAQAKLADVTEVLQIAGLPGVDIRIEDRVHDDGTSERVIRAVARDDGTHATSKGSNKNTLLNPDEKSVLRQLGFKHKGNGVFERKFDPTFWNAARDADPSALVSKASKKGAKKSFAEYKGNTNGDGAVFSFVDTVGKDGTKEQIKLGFRGKDGRRRKGTLSDHETYKNLGFKFEKNNPNGPGYYADYSQKLTSDLGLPATTRFMREQQNLATNNRTQMFQYGGRVPAMGEGYEGYEVGYNNLTDALVLYKDGRPFAEAKYSNALLDKVLGEEGIGTYFMEMSKNLAEGRRARAENKAAEQMRNFNELPANQEASRNLLAEAIDIFLPKNEAEANRNAEKEESMRNRRDTVRVKFRNHPEWVSFPILYNIEENGKTKQVNLLSELTTVTSGGQLVNSGYFWDALYSDRGEGINKKGEPFEAKYTDAPEVALDPRTGRVRRYTGEEIPELIVDNETNETLWDATKYDETKERPADDIKYVDRVAAKIQEVNEKGKKAKAEAEAAAKKAKTEANRKQRTLDEFEAQKLRESRTGETGVLDVEGLNDIAPEDKKAKYSADWRNNDYVFGSQQTAPLSEEEADEMIAGIDTMLRNGEISEDDAADRIRRVRGRVRPTGENVNAVVAAARQKGDLTAEEILASRAPGAYSRSSIGNMSVASIKSVFKNDSTETALARQTVSKLKDKLKDYKADALYDEAKAVEDKLEMAQAVLETLIKMDEERIKNRSNTGRPADTLKLTDAEKKKLSAQIKKIAKEEFESEAVEASSVEEPYANSQYDVAMEEDELGVAPVAAAMKDSTGLPLPADKAQFFREHPGSLNENGDVQMYYTPYVPVTDFSNERISASQLPGTMLFKDYVAATEAEAGVYAGKGDTLQAEEVYAALKRPIFADTDTLAVYPELPSAVRSALEGLGFDENTVSMLADSVAAEAQSKLVVDAAWDVANEAHEIDPEISTTDILEDIYYALGADGILMDDGAVVFDEDNVMSADFNQDRDTFKLGDYNYAKEGKRAFTIDQSHIDSLLEELRAMDEEEVPFADLPTDQRWMELGEKYGVIEGSDIPAAVSHSGKKTSTATKGLYENEVFVPERLRPAFREAVMKEMMAYTPVSDTKGLAEADKWLRNFASGTATNPEMMTGPDLEKAYMQWMGAAQEGSLHTKSDILKGYAVLAEMANTMSHMPESEITDGQLAAYEKLTAQIALTASKAGRMLQAIAAAKKMTPQGRLYYINQMIEQLRAELQKEKGLFQKRAEGVLDNYQNDETYQKLVAELDAIEPGQADTQAKLDAVEEKIIDHIAKQIPPTIADRVRAYRYLCMLGNFKTHIRNMASNTAMALTKIPVRELSGIAQDIGGLFKPKMEKTSSFIHRASNFTEAGRELLNFARDDYKRNMAEILQNGGKMGFKSKVMQKARSFGNSVPGKFLEKMSKLNGNALEGEDAIFLGLEYTMSLARYMAANGLTPETVSQNDADSLEKLNRAREYAIQNALEATYRQANILADALNTIEQKGGIIGKILVGGTAPFKRTPMNIVSTGLRYSPVGIVDALTRVSEKAQTGEIPPGEVVDVFCQGLTGSSIMAMGLWLALQGMAKAGGKDDDREEYYDQMLGSQKYSLQFGDLNMTFDWLTPISMPFFAGVTLWDEIKDKAFEDMSPTEMFTWALEAIKSTADPVTELSMLQGVSNALNSWSEDKPINQLLSSSAESYALQFVPTMSGQLLRTLDPTRRSTFASKDSTALGGKAGEQFLNKYRNKSLIANAPELIDSLRGLANGESWDFDINNNAYVDQWGREENGVENAAARAAYQFLAPWYARRYNQTSVDDKLTGIFEKSGSTFVIPRTPNSYFDIGGTTRLTADEFEKTKKTVGDISYRGLQDAFRYSNFDTLDTDSQVKVVENIYSYARQMAKIDYANSHDGFYVWNNKAEKDAALAENPDARGFVKDSDVDKIDAAQKAGLSMAQYFTVKQILSQFSKKADKKQALRDLGLSYEQRSIFE